MVTGLAPAQELARYAHANPELIAKLFPRYADDSTRCQLGLLEGCDTNGRVETHLPSGDLYACIKCVAKEQEEKESDVRRWRNSTARAWDWIHTAEKIGHVCPGREESNST